MRHLIGDLAYQFSVHQTIMWLVGNWPLDKPRTYIFNIRWMLGSLTEITVAIPTLIEVLKTHSEHGSKLENLMYMELCLLSFVKNTIFRLRCAKLEANMEAASEDWAKSRDKKSYNYMKRYARLGRLSSITLGTCGYLCFISYFISVLVTPWVPSKVSGKLIRNYALPFGWLTDDITDFKYSCLLLIQFLQTSIVYVRQCILDSFFFCITMHLCGQFDILKVEFLHLHENTSTDAKYKQQIRNLARRHCQLINLVQNIEYTFHLIVMAQSFTIVFVVGMNGLRLIIALRKGAFYLLMKSVGAIVFFVVQTMMYAHAGECLYRENSSFLMTIFDSPWQGLRRKRAKDIIFIMTRSNVPFYISGAKFFCLSYQTVTGIIRRAFTYVTYLQLTMTETEY